MFTRADPGQLYRVMRKRDRAPSTPTSSLRWPAAPGLSASTRHTLLFRIAWIQANAAALSQNEQEVTRRVQRTGHTTLHDPSPDTTTATALWPVRNTSMGPSASQSSTAAPLRVPYSDGRTLSEANMVGTRALQVDTGTFIRLQSQRIARRRVRAWIHTASRASAGTPACPAKPLSCGCPGFCPLAAILTPGSAAALPPPSSAEAAEGSTAGGSPKLRGGRGGTLVRELLRAALRRPTWLVLPTQEQDMSPPSPNQVVMTAGVSTLPLPSDVPFTNRDSMPNACRRGQTSPLYYSAARSRSSAHTVGLCLLSKDTDRHRT